MARFTANRREHTGLPAVFEDAVEATYQKHGGLLLKPGTSLKITKMRKNASARALAWNGAADVRPGSLKS